MDHGPTSARDAPPEENPSSGDGGSALLTAPVITHDTIISRASSPLPSSAGKQAAGAGPDARSVVASAPPPPGQRQRQKEEDENNRRYRPRTFSYISLLPFEAEPESERDRALHSILAELYIAVRAEDYSPGVLFWSRQLQNWLALKFEMPRPLRAKLTQMYYHLALAPGLDPTVSERLISMVVVLTRKYHYLKPLEDLTLDWRPLWKEFCILVLPAEAAGHQSGRRKSHKQLWKLCLHSQTYFDPADRREMLDEFLQYFSASDLSNGYVVVGLINALLPTDAAAAEAPLSRPAEFLPTLFHLWQLVARSRAFDHFFIDILCRLARDHLKCGHIEFAEHGIFTKEQCDHVFTAILRLTDIPVGQANSPYSSVDMSSGLGIYLEKDKKKHPIAHMIARWVVNSLSPLCLDRPDSMLANLEGLIQSVDTFFHPSNQGAWTTTLAQLVHYLVDMFVLRWNRERGGELDVPPERRITDQLRARFVLCLRGVTFMGIFSKGARVVQYYNASLQGLAYLEPGLMLPGALQRFYPSLQGLVEVHRTASSLSGLQTLAGIMARQKGYRCHLTALLALALPGIDANDLTKTQYTLGFIQTVAYSIPIAPLGGATVAAAAAVAEAGEDGTLAEEVEEDDELEGTRGGGGAGGTAAAVEWVQAEMERLEREGPDVRLDYDAELSDEAEVAILRSSTAGFGEFLRALLGRVFTLLENLPDSSHLRGGGGGGPSPEENVINALPSALAPVFASLSADLFEIALDQIASFVSSHVVHQGREAMAWTVNALCRADPAKTLRVFVPMLIANIRNEIDHNGAASGRSSGSDYLPRDRALVWHLIMLGMVVVNAGADMLAYRDELFGVARYLQDRCRGLPTVHIANLVHHMLITLTRTYPMDSALGEPTEEGGGASPAASSGAPVRDWGRSTPPSELTVRWHRPTPDEIAFAEELFAWQTESAIGRLNELMSDEPPAARGGRNKEWSDEVVRALGQIRLVVSGMATLFDPARASRGDAGDGNGDGNGNSEDNGNEQAGEGGDAHTNHEDDKMEVDQIAADKMRGDSHDENGSETQEKGDGVDQKGQPEGDALLAEGADDEVNMRSTYRCRDGYLLSPDDPVYDRIHALRDEIGRLLSRTHAWLGARHEDDVACYTALYAAYRTWITDVGMERSAHPLERYSRLYRSEIGSFRVSGLRKRYPRPLLVKRAEAYRLQRIKHNAAARLKGPLDHRLLSDLAESCLSQYADVRRAAQGAQDSSLKAILGGRPVVIPVVMARFRRAIQEEDHDRIKGGMYTLLFTSLVKTVVRDWRFAPEMARLYIETAGIDKQSIQALGNSALLTVADLGKATDRIVLTSREPIEAIISGEDQTPERERDRREAAIRTRRALLTKRRSRVERLKANLGLELTRRARGAHWNVASRCALMANALCLRFQTIAPAEFVELLTLGANDAHPGLRSTHVIALTSVLAAVDVRAAFGHDYENFLSGIEIQEQRYRVPVERAEDGTAFTDKFLDAFDREPTTDDDAEPTDLTACFVDSHHPGWLVWGSGFTVSPARPRHPAMAYDDTELAVRTQIGALITRDWLSRCFDFLKQEPRDSNNDRFRITNMYLLMHIFDLAHHGLTAASWDDIRDLTTAVYGDGSDKHQHRAAAEILASLLAGSGDLPVELRDRAWAFAAPLMLDIISDDLTSENLGYWLSCLHVITDSRDPRRYRELGGPLAAFRLDRGSDAAFKDSARVTLIEGIVADAGWHFRSHGPVLEDLLGHLDHPYKSVREAVGRCIAAIHRTRHHESATDVAALLSRDAAASSLGSPPYPATPELASSVKTAFDRLERWRAEREPGQQTPSPYTMGSKTVLSWLDAALCSHECSGLVQFFATPLLTQLLHMMDVKEDPELMRLAYHVYRHIPNVPMRVGEDAAVISTLVDIGRSAPSWHQRMRALINLQVLYFRRLFLTAPAQRDAMLEAVSDMLADPQLEVRTYAGSTLAGMIRCSPHRIRDPVIIRLKDRFERELRMNPMLARSRGPSSAAGDHPDEAQVQGRVVRRHAAVLGLGGLIEAFPYATPPPSWMPEVLATLASRAAADPGVVGKATKSILSEFKKTRQDSWAVDQKYFTPEQLEDLEGVLWKSYFA